LFKQKQNKQEESISIILQINPKWVQKKLSTGIHIESDWDTKNQVILKIHKLQFIQSQLDTIKSKVNSIYMILRLQEIPSIEDIHDKYLGKELKKSESFPTTNNISKIKKTSRIRNQREYV
jgi:hypothetical protein